MMQPCLPERLSERCRLFCLSTTGEYHNVVLNSLSRHAHDHLQRSTTKRSAECIADMMVVPGASGQVTGTTYRTADWSLDDGDFISTCSD
jgi:hypothetical protein